MKWEIAQIEEDKMQEYGLTDKNHILNYRDRLYEIYDLPQVTVQVGQYYNSGMAWENTISEWTGGITIYRKGDEIAWEPTVERNLRLEIFEKYSPVFYTFSYFTIRGNYPEDYIAPSKGGYILQQDFRPSSNSLRPKLAPK